jgi:hypothetical protein
LRLSAFPLLATAAPAASCWGCNAREAAERAAAFPGKPSGRWLRGGMRPRLRRACVFDGASSRIWPRAPIGPPIASYGGPGGQGSPGVRRPEPGTPTLSLSGGQSLPRGAMACHALAEAPAVKGVRAFGARPRGQFRDARIVLPRLKSRVPAYRALPEMIP